MSTHTHYTRRQFITRTLATTGTLGWTTASSQRTTGDPGTIDPAALEKFRAQLHGRVLVPKDPGYETARRIYFWNPHTERRPALVARCAHADDVRYAVEFARRHGLEIAVRGRGHSPMGWGISNGLVIDLTGMNRVAIDPARKTARIDAGVSSGDVMRQAGRHGLAPIFGGCPGVGAAGITLGGGLGNLSGLHGASCDNLLSARLTTADGQLLSADAERNPDLLWGLRGAGANFGIVTSFDCRLHPIGPVTAGEIYYPGREARTVLRVFSNFMADAPDSLQAALYLTPGERGVFIGICHAGDGAEADRLLRALRTVAAVTKDSIRRQEFADLANLSPTGAPNASFRYVKTVYRRELSGDVIDRLLDRLAEAPPLTVLAVTHYMHGEVCRVRPDATAFPLRRPGGVLVRINVDWSDPAAARRLMPWIDETCRLLRPSSGEQIYANYQSFADKGSAEAVFGSNLSRLIVLKNQYDPTNVFRHNSNVQPRRA
jgi:FAD/FMN-containing dehydrogenase